jgi:hypothetical protein
MLAGYIVDEELPWSLPDPVIPSNAQLGLLRAKSNDGETLSALSVDEEGKFNMKFPLIPSKIRLLPNDSLAVTLAVFPFVTWTMVQLALFCLKWYVGWMSRSPQALSGKSKLRIYS